MTSVQTYTDLESLAQAAAEQCITVTQSAIAAQGFATIALAGGSTPRALYQLLATDTYAARVDWANVHLFWGDERTVAPDHADSNYRMVREALLDHVPIPATNVHRLPGEQSPEQAANSYEQELRSFFHLHSASLVEYNGQLFPPFDLILLGMGDDGHTASLFPHTAALSERKRWVVANHVPQQDTWRLTLTYPLISAANHVTFFVAGAKKATTLQQVLRGPHQPELLPSQLIQPVNGELVWLVDDAAARALELAK